MILQFKEILKELNYFEYLEDDWDYFPKKYQDMFTKYMNEHFKCRSELEGKYAFIDTFFIESCGMSYRKAIELRQKCKEIQEKLKNIQKDFAH